MREHGLKLVALVLLALFATACDEGPPRLSLWHAYRGDEATALEEAVHRFELESGLGVDVLAVPFAGYASKLEAAIPREHGPDVFVDVHNRLGKFERLGLVAPVGDALGEAKDFAEPALKAVTVDGKVLGVPLAQKSFALYINRSLLPETPKTLTALVETKMPAGTFPFAYESESAYSHAAFLHTFHGEMLTSTGDFGMVGKEAEASLDLVHRWTEEGHIPGDADGALVAQLFSSGKVAAVMSGPWLLADLHVRFPLRIEPLPPLDEVHGAIRPYLTVDAAMLTPSGAGKPGARSLARFLAHERSSLEIRSSLGRQILPLRNVETQDAVAMAFRRAAEDAIPMPTSGAMRAAWVPADQAIRKVLRGDASSHDALVEAEERFRNAAAEAEPSSSPTPLFLVFSFGLVLAAFALVRRAKTATFRSDLRASKEAYRYLGVATVTVFFLVIVPLLVGAVTSFYSGTRNAPVYVGLANYVSILTARGGPLFGNGSFYRTLAVTVLWTVVNVAFHVVIGLVLALILSKPKLAARPLYRVLLILPWAAPSYITALTWKGMFQKQFGAVNALLGLVGVEPVSWFSKFSTAFAANVTTNVWLGFPFMMVVAMGALTSIPKEVLEAAEIDGATRTQRFFRVTLPLLRPSLLPSVILGAVWTFNMFNVVFLVSGGDPDGSTDILVSEAYRWAFTRDAQIGYAAAYAVIIFVLLFSTSELSDWWKRRRDAQARAAIAAHVLTEGA